MEGRQREIREAGNQGNVEGKLEVSGLQAMSRAQPLSSGVGVERPFGGFYSCTGEREVA